MKKYDIINALGRRYGLRRYLEICTPSTGLTYGLVDSTTFETKHRLVYNCPETDNDGLDYTYRTVLPVSYELTRAIKNATHGLVQYDLIFVDPWHTLKSTETDLFGAWRLLRPGGFLVVHDCNPEREDLTSPEFQIGEWCGVTYRAFIDFVLSKPSKRYCTVDTDYGCGVVQKIGEIGREPADENEAEAILALNWIIAREDDAGGYRFFDFHRSALLNLISVDQFQNTYLQIEDENLAQT